MLAMRSLAGCARLVGRARSHQSRESECSRPDASERARRDQRPVGERRRQDYNSDVPGWLLGQNLAGKGILIRPD